MGTHCARNADASEEEIKHAERPDVTCQVPERRMHLLLLVLQGPGADPLAAPGRSIALLDRFRECRTGQPEECCVFRPRARTEKLRFANVGIRNEDAWRQ